jgi:hypothetical protein
VVPLPISAPAATTSPYLGLTNATFSGLTVAYSNMQIPPTGYQGKQQEPNAPAAISFVNPQNVTFESGIIEHTGAFGIAFTNDNTATAGSGGGAVTCPGSGNPMPDCNSVTGNQILDMGDGGIRMGTTNGYFDSDISVLSNNTISNNLVDGLGRVFAGGAGILIGDSHHNLVSQNTVIDGYKDGIAICEPDYPGDGMGHQTTVQCGGANWQNSNPSSGVPVSTGASNNTVSQNLVHTIGQGVLSDDACIYLATTQALGNLVEYNTCYDVAHPTEDLAGAGQLAGYGGNGLYIDNFTQSVTLQSNLVYNVSSSGIQSSVGPNDSTCTTCANNITNNIFAYFGSQAIIRNLQESLGTIEVPSFSFTKNMVEFDNGLYDPVNHPLYPTVMGGHGYLCYNPPPSGTGLGDCSGSGATSIFNFNSNGYTFTGSGTDSLTQGSTSTQAAFYTVATCSVGAPDGGYAQQSRAFSGDPSWNWTTGGADTAASEDLTASSIGTASFFQDSGGCQTDGTRNMLFDSHGSTVKTAIGFSPWFSSDPAGTSTTYTLPSSSYPTRFPLVPLSCSAY